jgi:hypothetical protein
VRLPSEKHNVAMSSTARKLNETCPHCKQFRILCMCSTDGLNTAADNPDPDDEDEEDEDDLDDDLDTGDVEAAADGAPAASRRKSRAALASQSPIATLWNFLTGGTDIARSLSLSPALEAHALNTGRQLLALRTQSIPVMRVACFKLT